LRERNLLPCGVPAVESGVPFAEDDGDAVLRIHVAGFATFRGVEFEEAIFLEEAEFETSAVMPGDCPNMSAVAVAVKSRAAAADSKRVRRNLHILFLPPIDWALYW